MNQTGTEMPYLERLYFAHFDMLYRLACNELYRYTGSAEDADDVVQDVFMLAIRKWPTLQDHPNQVGWLIKVTHLMCMNYSHARQRERDKEKRSKDKLLCHQPKEYGPLYSGAVEDGMSAQDVLISLEQTLKSEDYQIVKAYCVEKRSMDEICQQTGLSYVALRVRIHRIRQEITKILFLLVTILTSRNI